VSLNQSFFTMAETIFKKQAEIFGFLGNIGYDRFDSGLFT